VSKAKKDINPTIYANSIKIKPKNSIDNLTLKTDDKGTL
jgi:hypothetical protein